MLDFFILYTPLRKCPLIALPFKGMDHFATCAFSLLPLKSRDHVQSLTFTLSVVVLQKFKKQYGSKKVHS